MALEKENEEASDSELQGYEEVDEPDEADEAGMLD